jgi:GT2 family glycosyltransferase
MGREGASGYGMIWRRRDLKPDWLGLQNQFSYPVPLLSGCFMVMRRETVESVGGFDDGMIIYGSEDLELCMRLWMLGYSVLVEPQVTVLHQFREKHPYSVEWKMYLYNLLRMIFAHFNSERIAHLLEEIRHYQDFATVMGQIADSDIWMRRARLAECRVHDDDWFFERFQMVL